MGNFSDFEDLLIRKLKETEAYLEPCETSKIEFFCCKIVKESKLASRWLFSQKISIVDVWQGSKYASQKFYHIVCIGVSNPLKNTLPP